MRSIARLALLMVAVASPAFADEWNEPCDRPQYGLEQPRGGRGHHWGRRHWQRQPNEQQGRWEQRNVQKWVQGNPITVWVEGRCVDAWHCSAGQYQTQYTEGHFEMRLEWVWVPFSVYR